MSWLSISVILYGIAVAGGGIAGYAIPPHSKVSIITGGLAGLILIVAGILSKNNPRTGFGLTAMIAVALIGLFIFRFMATHKPMPAFGVIGLSVVMLILLVVGHFMNPAGSAAP